MALTSKRQAFAQQVALGDSLADAYRNSGYQWQNMKPAVIRTEASRVMANPDVSLLVERLRVENERSIRAGEVSDRDKVLTKLRDLMGDLQPANIQLGAAIALGKTAALFTDVVVTDDKSESVEEVRAELDKMIEQAEKQAGLTQH